MSSKNTWLWLTAAAALFAFIFLFEHFRPHPQVGPRYLLPGLNPKEVTSVQIRPAGQPEILAVRTNGGWALLEPVVYPAQATNVENLLNALHSLTIAHKISEQELRQDPKADDDYGIEPPEISLILRQNNSTNPIYFGHKTSPGDQVFARVIGIEGVSIVDADVLDLFPQNANAWRDRTLANFANASFDRITVTNTVKNQSFLLQRDMTNKLWTMAFPMKTRADTEMVQAAIEKLETLKVQHFVSDDPKADLDAFGLQPPALTLAFGKGTNTLFTLDFGRQLTNRPGMVYARRRDQNAVVAISTNALGQWDGTYDVFRDRHLVTLTDPIDRIDVQAQDAFSLTWETNGVWSISPQNFPTDQILAAGFARKLGELQVADFVKDSVTAPDLPHYGLTPQPARKYILHWSNLPTATNPPTELDFGTNSSGQIFARRIGEDAVYGIAPLDFEALPSASWELRDRKIWNFDATNVARIIIKQDGKTRVIVHGTNGWTLASGSSGIINDSAIEDTTRDLGRLTAFAWVARGAAKLPDFGIAAGGYEISIELKSGEKLGVQFGRPTPAGAPFAAVQFDGEPWIFEFPPDVYPSVQFCLTIPPSP